MTPTQYDNLRYLADSQEKCSNLEKNIAKLQIEYDTLVSQSVPEAKLKWLKVLEKKLQNADNIKSALVETFSNSEAAQNVNLVHQIRLHPQSSESVSELIESLRSENDALNQEKAKSLEMVARLHEKIADLQRDIKAREQPAGIDRQKEIENLKRNVSILTAERNIVVSDIEKENDKLKENMARLVEEKNSLSRQLLEAIPVPSDLPNERSDLQDELDKLKIQIRQMALDQNLAKDEHSKTTKDLKLVEAAYENSKKTQLEREHAQKALVKSLEDSLSTLTLDCTNIRATNKDLEVQILGLKNSNQALTSGNRLQLQQLEELSDKLKGLEASKNAEILKLRDILATKDNLLANNAKEISLLKQNLSEKLQEILELETLVSGNEARISDLTSQIHLLTENSKLNVASLEEELNRAKNILASTVKETNYLKSKNSEKHVQYLEISESLENSRLNLETLRNEFKSLEEDKKRITSLYDESNLEKSALEVNLRQLQHELNSLAQNQENMAKINEVLSLEKTAVESELRMLQSEYGMLTETKERSLHLAEDLSQEKNDIKTELHQCYEKLKVVQTDCGKRDVEIENLKKDLEQKDAELHNSRELESTARENVNSLSAALNSLEAKNATLMNETQEIITAKESELQELRESDSRTKLELDQMRLEFGDVQEMFAKVSLEMEQLYIISESKTKQIDNMIKEHDHIVGALRDEISQYVVELDSKTAQVEKSQEDIKMYQIKYVEIREEMISIKNTSEDLVGLMNVNESLFREADAKRLEALQEIGILGQKIEQLQNEKSISESHLESLSNRMESAVLSNSKLVELNESLKQELAAKTDNLAKVDSKMELFSTRLVKANSERDLLENEKGDISAQLEQALVKLESTTKILEQAKIEIESLLHQMELLRTEKEKLIELNQNNEARRESTLKMLENALKDSHSERDRLKVEYSVNVERLEKSLNESLSQKEVLLSEIEQLRAKGEEVNQTKESDQLNLEKLGVLEGSLKRQTEQLEELANQISDYREMIASNIEKIKEQEQHNAVLERIISEKNIAINDLSESANIYSRERHILVNQRDEATAKLEISNSTIKEFQEKIRHLSIGIQETE